LIVLWLIGAARITMEHFDHIEHLVRFLSFFKIPSLFLGFLSFRNISSVGGINLPTILAHFTKRNKQGVVTELGIPHPSGTSPDSKSHSGWITKMVSWISSTFCKLLNNLYN
jgi:hypothetical protein